MTLASRESMAARGHAPPETRLLVVRNAEVRAPNEASHMAIPVGQPARLHVREGVEQHRTSATVAPRNTDVTVQWRVVLLPTRP